MIGSARKSNAIRKDNLKRFYRKAISQQWKEEKSFHLQSLLIGSNEQLNILKWEVKHCCKVFTG